MVLLTVSKKLQCWPVGRHLWSCKLNTCEHRFYWTLHFDTSFRDLDLDSRSQGCEKAKTCVPFTSQSFQCKWMVSGLLLKILDHMDPILMCVRVCVCVCLSEQHSRERTLLWWFHEKEFNFGLRSDIYRWWLTSINCIPGCQFVWPDLHWRLQ